jgi:NADPH:quinone reductase-like Zn-dependent oxidoreductase
MKAHDEMDEAEALLEDWALLFPQDLSDEAAAALSQFVTVLSSLMASRYGRQISHSRHCPPQAQKEPF